MSTISDKEVKIWARILRAIADEIEINKELTQRILDRTGFAVPAKQKSASGLNLFQIFSEKGDSGLLECLSELDLRLLKQIIGEYRLDPSALSRKWRSKERLVKFIVERIVSRSKHGEVFLHKEEA